MSSVDRDCALWVLKCAYKGGVKVHEGLEHLVVREFPDLDGARVQKIARLAESMDPHPVRKDMAMPSAKKDRIGGQEAIEKAVAFYVNNPDATGSDAWKWLTDSYDVGIKRSTWEHPDYSGAARKRAKALGVPETSMLAGDEVPEFAVVRCAQCSEVFSMDKRLRDERRVDGEDFYCPNGCCLTYHSDNAADPHVADDEPPPRLFSMSMGDAQLSAYPGDNDKWVVQFSGPLNGWVLNEIINDLYDELLVAQGIDVEGIGTAIRGTVGSGMARAVRDVKRSVDELAASVKALGAA